MLLNLTNLTNREMDKVKVYLSSIDVAFIDKVINENIQVLTKQKFNKEHLILGSLEFLNYIKDNQRKFDMNPEYVKAFINWLGCQSDADTKYLVEYYHLNLNDYEISVLDHAVFNFYCELEACYERYLYDWNE